MKKQSPISCWLVTVITLIIAIIIVGGITRLTGSGLSMVKWRPVFGLLPPLNNEQWQLVFDQYKQFPQYQSINTLMTLSGFKKIFFWEYLHRVLGRIIGLSILLPLAWFWMQNKLDRPLKIKGLVMGVLVIAQGVLGWYMVKSGLINNPQVSHFRLAAHLLLALFLMQYITWAWLQQKHENLKFFLGHKWMAIWTGLLYLQIMYGAFTAGLKAGWGYNTYPLMNGQWLPESATMSLSFFQNILSNPVMIQFIHRHLGLLVLGGFLILWTTQFKRSKKREVRKGAMWVLVLLAIQVSLGIITLLYIVPIVLAVLHQVTAALLVLLSTGLLFHLSHSKNTE